MSTITRRGLFAAPAILVARPAAAASPLVVGVAGQSLGAAWKIASTTAWSSFGARMRELGDTRALSQINVTLGGSALLRENVNPSYPTYYWLEDNLSAGPLLRQAKSAIAAAVTKPSAWLWVQGEQDSGRVPTGDAQDDAFVARYLAGLKTIIATLGALGAPVFIQILGPRVDGGVKTMTRYRSQTLVRRAQYEALCLPGVYEAARPDMSLTLADVVHPTSDATGYGWLGAETANAMKGRV